MKKLKKFVVLCLAVIMLFTACGKKGEEVTKELSITQMQTICGGIHRQSFGSSIPAS